MGPNWNYINEVDVYISRYLGTQNKFRSSYRTFFIFLYCCQSFTISTSAGLTYFLTIVKEKFWGWSSLGHMVAISIATGYSPRTSALGEQFRRVPPTVPSD